MSYNNNKEVMNRIQEHLDYLDNKGLNVIFIAHQGSFNYELNYENSDIDTKAVVVPDFKDFVLNKSPISTTYVLDNDEHIDVKDIRLMCEMWQKENISYIELLYSKYIIINPEYKDLINELIKNRDKIVNINTNQFLRCIKGMRNGKIKSTLSQI